MEDLGTQKRGGVGTPGHKNAETSVAAEPSGRAAGAWGTKVLKHQRLPSRLEVLGDSMGGL